MCHGSMQACILLALPMSRGWSLMITDDMMMMLVPLMYVCQLLKVFGVSTILLPVLLLPAFLATLCDLKQLCFVLTQLRTTFVCAFLNLAAC